MLVEPQDLSIKSAQGHAGLLGKSYKKFFNGGNSVGSLKNVGSQNHLYTLLSPKVTLTDFGYQVNLRIDQIHSFLHNLATGSNFVSLKRSNIFENVLGTGIGTAYKNSNAEHESLIRGLFSLEIGVGPAY